VQEIKAWEPRVVKAWEPRVVKAWEPRREEHGNRVEESMGIA